MMHLAAYDVHEDQRRAQLSALLQAYGDRIQYSVFLLGITPEELVEIQSRAAGIIDENTDSLWIVRQGGPGGGTGVGLKEAGNPGCPQPGVLETPSDGGVGERPKTASGVYGTRLGVLPH